MVSEAEGEKTDKRKKKPVAEGKAKSIEVPVLFGAAKAEARPAIRSDIF